MIKQYEETDEDEWDNFVLNKSWNGNFLQSRRFLNYHKRGEYQDHSLLFYKNKELVAVMPANIEDDGKVLLSHAGSTFGGLIISEKNCDTTDYNWIFSEMIDDFRMNGFEKAELRMPHWLYQRNDKMNELLEYYFQLNEFKIREEVGFFIDLSGIVNGFEKSFDSLRRRKLKKSIKANLSFRYLESDNEIKEFYDVLSDNMKKFNKTPLHTCSDLLDFKHDRLRNEISFYGVYKDNMMIAGSMVFNFCNKKVFHTQYLASRHDCLDECPNEFLYTNLIMAAKEQGFRYLSYGTATLEHGNVYNESLGLYKEGYDTDTYVNKTYIWNR